MGPWDHYSGGAILGFLWNPLIARYISLRLHEIHLASDEPRSTDEIGHASQVVTILSFIQHVWVSIPSVPVVTCMGSVPRDSLVLWKLSGAILVIWFPPWWEASSHITYLRRIMHGNMLGKSAMIHPCTCFCLHCLAQVTSVVCALNSSAIFHQK